LESSSMSPTSSSGTGGRRRWRRTEVGWQPRR
jgi:hypothetical protein